MHLTFTSQLCSINSIYWFLKHNLFSHASVHSQQSGGGIEMEFSLFFPGKSQTLLISLPQPPKDSWDQRHKPLYSFFHLFVCLFFPLQDYAEGNLVKKFSLGIHGILSPLFLLHLLYSSTVLITLYIALLHFTQQILTKCP